MSDCCFDTQMAGSTERCKIVGTICFVDQNKSPSTIDMVNVKRTSIFRFRSAQATYFITIKNGKSETPPMRSKFQRSSAAPIGVRCSYSRLLCTLMGTKLATTFLFTSKGAESNAAVFTGQFRSGYQAFIAALKRTVPDSWVTHPIKHFFTYDTSDQRKRILFPIFDMTRWVAEFQFGFLFHGVVRPLKFIAAVGAHKYRSVNHRCRVARLIAKECLGIVSLKIYPTLGACFDH
jgi:hypothetical protein